MKIYLNQSQQFQLIDIKNLPFVTFERWNFCDSYRQNRSNDCMHTASVSRKYVSKSGVSPIS